MVILNLRVLFSSISFAGVCLSIPLGRMVPEDEHSFITREGVKYHVFEHAGTGTKIEYVKNSGICETTPGVNQYSGYLSVGTNMNMWFWFFESRSDPTTAPLAAWFNGGPGCSSMIGLFQENGPCHFINGSSTPSINPLSWNTYANMLYIDQPIGTGFSYGTDDATSTETAAPYVWKLLQAFFAQFPQYQNRDFGIFTESYGGHYGPEFAEYILKQNDAIDDGTLEGEKINLVALGINNGWFDSLIQEKSAIDFAYNNSYRQLISSSTRTSLLNAYNNKCAPALQLCDRSSANTQCRNADTICYNSIDAVIQDSTDFNVYDIRNPSNDPNPPETYVSYLQSSAVMKAIGARATYQECPNAPYLKFQATGDDARPFLKTLSNIVSAGLPTLMWAGDADYICNWVGNLAVANEVTFNAQSSFRSKDLAPYTVNGAQGGMFKTAENLSFLRVFAAGHEVPYYQPELSLQVFKQMMQNTTITSTFIRQKNEQKL